MAGSLRMQTTSWTGRSGARRIFLLVILGAVLYFVARILAPFFAALAWAAILATVFHPVYKWMGKRVERRGVASVATCLLLVVAIILPVLLLGFLMAGESVREYATLENVVANGLPARIEAIRNSASYRGLAEDLKRMGLAGPGLGTAAMRVLRTGSRFLVEHSASYLSDLLNFVLQLFVMLLGLYYLFLHGPQILRELRSLVPLRPEYKQEIFEKFQDVVHATFTGNLAVALIQAVLGSLGFLIFGLSAPLLLGAVMGLASLVPIVGSSLVWVPVALFFMLTGSIVKGLLVLVAFGLLAASVDNIVKPILVRRGMKIHTLWVFISVIGGLSVFGFLGLVLGPFLFSLLVVLYEVYKVEFKRSWPDDAVT